MEAFSLRPKRVAAAAQYGRRARQNGASPAQVKANAGTAVEETSSVSDSSDVEGKDADYTPASKSKTTPKELSQRGRARAQTASPKKLPVTPSPLAKTASASSTSKLPSRPPRSGSPSLPLSGRILKRSASASPQKLERTASGSVSPSKFRSRTPTRPAKDLASLFDAFGPEPRNPFARSESHPVVRLQQEELTDETAPTLPREPQSPTLGLGEFPSPGVLTSPTKRARLMERMAPRSLKAGRDDSGSTNSPFSRNGSLRKTETDPEVSLYATAVSQEGDEKSGNTSEVGSNREVTPKVDTQENSGIGSRRLAGIKQEAASNAKRTYGLQRSFLADHAEENLLATQPQPPEENIEDEIEQQLLKQSKSNAGRGSARTSSAIRPVTSSAAPQRESYADLLRRWGEGADEIEWDESQNPTLNLKSITSLRSVGELRRFNDDLEYLFSGLEATQPLAVRRSSAIDFIRMLCGNPDVDDENSQEDTEDDFLAQSAEFLRKLKATDKIVRAYDLFRLAVAGDGVDEILDATFGILLAKLLRTPGDAEPLIRERKQHLLDCLCRMLLRANNSDLHKSKDGFARLRYPQGGRKDAHTDHRCSLVELQAIAKASKLFLAGSAALTLRNLLLAAACSLVALPKRWLGDAIALHKPHGNKKLPNQQLSIVSAVNEILEEEAKRCRVALNHRHSAAATVSGRSAAQVSAHAIEKAVDIDVVDLCLRFLEKLVEPVDDPSESAIVFDIDFVDRTRDLITFCMYSATLDSASAQGTDANSAKASSGPSRTSDRPLQVVHGIVKLLLDLSHVDSRWSECMSGSVALQSCLLRALFHNHQGALDLAKLEHSALGKKANMATGPDVSTGEVDDRSTALSDANIQVTLALALRQDIVLLALALLTDLLLRSPPTEVGNIRDTLAEVRLDPTCLHDKCVFGCGCRGAVSSITLLARLFLDTRSVALEQDDSEAAYLSNSVATALAQFAVGGDKHLTICRQALDAQAEALRVVAAPHAPANGFTCLLEAVEDFAAVHEAAFKLVHGAADAAVTTEESGQIIKDLAHALRSMISS